MIDFLKIPFCSHYDFENKLELESFHNIIQKNYKLIAINNCIAIKTAII